MASQRRRISSPLVQPAVNMPGINPRIKGGLFRRTHSDTALKLAYSCKLNAVSSASQPRAVRFFCDEDDYKRKCVHVFWGDFVFSW